jgi:predicted nucleic acid-binding Zn ribbon protein
VRTKRAMNFNVNTAVKGALRSLNLDAKMRGYAVWGVWDQAVGETVAQQAQPTLVRGGTLFVKCSSSAWMQELQFMKGTICKELNRLVGREAVKDIKFQMGTIARPTQETSSINDQEVSLDDDERARIDEALRPLQDAETREIVRRLMVKGASLKKQ